jgi:hypothetical protein
MLPFTLLLFSRHYKFFRFQDSMKLFRVVLLGIAALPIAAQAQSVPLTQDSSVIPGTAANFGVLQTINVGGASGFQGLVQFDLSTLPAGTTSSNISKATLVLFVKAVNAAGTVNISTANGAWTESGVNGNNAPTAGQSVASGVAVSAMGSYLYVDATSAIQSWVTTPDSNNGFIVTPNDGLVNVSSTVKRALRPVIRRFS